VIVEKNNSYMRNFKKNLKGTKKQPFPTVSKKLKKINSSQTN
jgi:hypothetical protein